MTDLGQPPLTISLPAAEPFVVVGVGDGAVTMIPDHAAEVVFDGLSYIQRKVLEARLRALADLVAAGGREEVAA